MRIAVIIPDRRIWRWHVGLLGELRQRHAADVFLTPAAQYPAVLRLYLAIERRICGRRDTARLATETDVASFLASPDVAGPEEYDLVIDLSGEAKLGASTTVLRLAFDGKCDGLAPFGSLLAGRPPLIEVVDADSTPLQTSYPASSDNLVLGISLISVFARVQTLLLRALSLTAPPILCAAMAAPDRPAGYSGARLLKFALHYFVEKVKRLVLKPFARHQHWLIALGTSGDSASLAPPDVKPQELPSRYYCADPFLVEDRGAKYLFAERLPYGSRRGELVMAPLRQDGTICEFKTILRQPYHLSYPQIFRDGEDYYMVPETGGASRVELYRAERFPDVWTRDTVILDGISIGDPTLVYRNGEWWLFGAERSRFGSQYDELVLYHSTSLRGAWKPHPRNPVVSDCRYARPAGRFVECGERLLRPAQDCERGYGTALVWLEVLELTPSEYRERVVGRWNASDFGNYVGVHTYSQIDGVSAVDLKAKWYRRRISGPERRMFPSPPKPGATRDRLLAVDDPS